MRLKTWAAAATAAAAVGGVLVMAAPAQAGASKCVEVLAARGYSSPGISKICAQTASRDISLSMCIWYFDTQAGTSKELAYLACTAARA